MRRECWLLALLLLLAACGGGETGAETSAARSTDSAGSTTTSAPTPAEAVGTSYDQLIERYAAADGIVTPELAMTAFALQFGDMPGSLNLPRDGSQPQSGTNAMRWVLSVWDDLTLAQQEAVNDRIARYLGSAAASTTAGNASLGSLGLAGVEPRVVAVVAEPTPAQERALWDGMAEDAARKIRERLGGVPLVYELFLVDEVEDGDAETGPPTLMFTDTAFPTNAWCRIAVGGARTFPEEAQKKSAIYHEMFHCWSLMNSDNLLAWAATPGWYQEGVASWVGESLSGGSPYSASWWPRYLLPLREDLIYPIFVEEYSAIGFWSSVDAALGGDLWGEIPNLNRAAEGGDSAALMNAVLGRIGPDALAGIPAEAALRADWGANWIMSGPGLRGEGRIANEISLADGLPGGISVGPGWQQLQSFSLDMADPEAPTFVEVTGRGWMSARWNTGEEFTITEAETRTFFVGECTCPDGT